MAAPNIVNVTTITGKTAVANVTTVTANVITNAAGSSTVVKLNNITLSNYTAGTVGANVIFNRSSASPTNYYIGGSLSVPAQSTLVALAKDASIYLEEGDVLQINASANSSISMVASYEIIS